jgi:hypothetical protein
MHPPCDVAARREPPRAVVGPTRPLPGQTLAMAIRGATAVAYHSKRTPTGHEHRSLRSTGTAQAHTRIGNGGAPRWAEREFGRTTAGRRTRTAMLHAHTRGRVKRSAAPTHAKLARRRRWPLRQQPAARCLHIVRVRPHARTHAQYAPTHTHTHARTHARKHARKKARMQDSTHARTQESTNARKHACKTARTHARTPARPHARTQESTRARQHARTHASTQAV